MLRQLSAETGITLNVLMFTRHAERINTFFERLQAGRKLRLIQVEPGSLSAAFDMRAAIARGEFVGILGDRIWPSEQHRTVTLPFLGRPARFPLGPYLLQGVLGCPMLLHDLRPHRPGALHRDDPDARARRRRAQARAREARRRAGAALRLGAGAGLRSSTRSSGSTSSSSGR